MLIAHEEVFGPVLCMYKFRTEAEGVALANANEFGLGGAVFTLDYTKGERVAAMMRTGMCNVNDFGVNYLCMVCVCAGIVLWFFCLYEMVIDD